MSTPNPVVLFRDIGHSAPFYMDLYPGNTYRKTSDSCAEFIKHRLGSRYNGLEISVSPSTPCRRQPLDFDPSELLSDEIVPKNKKPKSKTTHDHDLLK